MANEELRIGRSSFVYREVAEKWQTVWPIWRGKVVFARRKDVSSSNAAVDDSNLTSNPFMSHDLYKIFRNLLMPV